MSTAEIANDAIPPRADVVHVPLHRVVKRFDVGGVLPDQERRQVMA